MHFRKIQWFFFDLFILFNIYSLYLLFSWDNYINENFQMVTKSLLNSTYFNVTSSVWKNEILFGLDQISILFIIITTFLFPIAVISNWNTKLNSSFLNFFLLLLILECGLILAFSTVDLFLFYVFFEILTIPTFFLIYIYGEHITKIRAASLFLIYSLTSSTFLTGGICLLFYSFGTTTIINLISGEAYEGWDNIYDINHSTILFLFIFIGLAIKIPLVPFHIWLPEAHAEAVTGVSIILAGIILKLGGYGLIRFLLPLFSLYSFLFSWIYIICLIGIIYIAFICTRVQNLKQLIAYSSINHMSAGTLGIISNTKVGISGGILSMIQHSLTAPCFFFLAGILYETYGTYNINLISNLSYFAPLFSTLFFFNCLVNIAFPLTGAFVSELLISFGLFKINFQVLLIFVLNSFITAFYTFWLLNRLIYSENQITINNINFQLSMKKDINRKSFIILFILILLTLFIGIFPYHLLIWISSCQNIFYSF